MNHRLIALGALLVSFLAFDPCRAQEPTQPFYGVTSTTGAKGFQPVDATHGLPVGAQAVAVCGAKTLTAGIIYPITQDLMGTICTAGGGGGGGAVTIADGSDVTQGAIADAASAAGGAGTLSAKLRLMTTQLGTINMTLGSPFQAGGTLTANLGNPTSDRTATGTLTTTNQTVAVNSQGTATVGVVVTANTNSTLAFEGTVDGTNWASINGTPSACGAQVNGVASSGTGQWTLTSGGFAQIRARVSAIGATPTVTISLDAGAGDNISCLINAAQGSLPSGTNNVGNVGITGYSFAHIATSTTTTIKSGSGTLHTTTINNLGTVASLTTIYDNTAGSGTVIASINTLAGQTSYIYDIAFSTGLTVVTTGTVAPDVTVSYR